MAVVATLLMAACANPGGALDPFGEDEGKADGASAFFGSGKVHSFELEDDAELIVRGPLGTAKYKHFAIERTPSELEGRPRIEIELDKGDKLAGMTNLLLVPIAAGPSRIVTAAQLYARAGAVAPRTARAQLIADDADQGLFLVIEVVDDKFLDRRFDDHHGNLYLSADAPSGDDLRRLGERVALPAAGEHALGSVLDLERLIAVLAANRALGADARAPQALYNACSDKHPCFAPIAALEGHPAPFPVLDDAGARLLQIPALRRRWVEVLDTLRACLESASCAEAGDPETARALSELVTRERTFDAPDGDADYASFSRDAGGRLQVAFRNLTPGLYARAVSLVTTRKIELAWSAADNLWRGSLDEPARPFSYHFEVTGDDGAHTQVSDPASRSGTLDPAAVDRLTLLSRHRVDLDEPSDLVWYGAGLYTVSDTKDNLYALDPATGSTDKLLDVKASDLEALAIDPLTGHFLIGDEGHGRVWHIDDDGSRKDPIELDDALDGNSGIEGLTIRPGDGHLFVAKEKDPARIFELDADGHSVTKRRIDFARDLSALTWSEEDGHLYALSDEDQTLYRLDAAWNVEASWPIPVVNPEGIAIHDGRLYVVSDSENELLVFAFNAWRF